MLSNYPKLQVLVIVLTFFSIIYSQEFGRYQYQKEESTENQVLGYQIGEDGSIFALEGAIDPNNYILGPGDKLLLNILTIENINMSLVVGPAGDILIPSVGTFYVAGKKLSTTITEMEKSIGENAYPNAKVTLSLLTVRKFKIQIKGAVNKPGFFIIDPITRLDEIVAAAKGFHRLAKEYNIIVNHANGESEVIDFFEYWMEGDLDNNPIFIEGDVIDVPFGDLKTEGIMIRGSVENRGYDIIKTGETLGNFLRRQTKLDEDANLDNIIITRRSNDNIDFISIPPAEFESTSIQAGDVIDILSERAVMVNGFIEKPGSFKFHSGFTVADYLSMAGGNTIEGDPDKSITRHLDGSVEKGQMVVVRRGDVIIVPRATQNILFGQMSILQIVTSIASIILTYIAATK